MKFSTTLIFILLFVLVLFFYFELSPPRTEAPFVPPAGDDSAGGSTFSLGKDDRVVWLQIQNIEKNETATFVLKKGLWMLKQPVRYEADQGFVKAVIQELLRLEKVTPFVPERKWDEYGLLRPNLKIGIETQKDPHRRYLCLGDPSPVSQMIFARWEGEESYFLVDQSMMGIFDVSLYRLCEKRIFRVSREDVSRLMYRIESKMYKLEKRNGIWTWVGPESLNGITMRPEDAERILDLIGNLYIKDFMTGGQQGDTGYGFSERVDYIKLWDNRDVPHVFYLGGEYPGRDAFYGRREGDDTVFLVDRLNIQSLFDQLVEIARGYEEPSTRPRAEDIFPNDYSRFR
ncbi:MAG: DUF4340 domain-containing protein [Candidatus Omnitrophica bacterium]|nr:DUF4340 domain-containing protein [Candidatus Omnitrophota bacterium]MDD5671839.1 DUF4340 domain-containing protein [Candidatus Omnitrophota bacterium]